MGACDTWNVEINILVYENEMFLLPAEFHFNNLMLIKKKYIRHSCISFSNILLTEVKIEKGL